MGPCKRDCAETIHPVGKDWIWSISFYLQFSRTGSHPPLLRPQPWLWRSLLRLWKPPLTASRNANWALQADISIELIQSHIGQPSSPFTNPTLIHKTHTPSSSSLQPVKLGTGEGDASGADEICCAFPMPFIKQWRHIGYNCEWLLRQTQRCLQASLIILVQPNYLVYHWKAWLFEWFI